MSKAIAYDVSALRDSRLLRLMKVKLMREIKASCDSKKHLWRRIGKTLQKNNISQGDECMFNITLLLECLFVGDNGAPSLLKDEDLSLIGDKCHFKFYKSDLRPLYNSVLPYALNYADLDYKFELAKLVILCHRAGHNVCPFFERLAVRVSAQIMGRRFGYGRE